MKERESMKHIHKYEPLMHQRVASELAKSGIEAAELRKCRECGKEMPFLLTKKGIWVSFLRIKKRKSRISCWHSPIDRQRFPRPVYINNLWKYDEICVTVNLEKNSFWPARF